MLGGPLGFSLAPFVRSSKSLSRWIQPVATWYADRTGYRRVGLKYDDLIIEERDDVQKALSRLPARESYDRIYRINRASQASVLHRDLPKDKWTKPDQDTRYLTPYVNEAHAEDVERTKWDTMQLQKH